MQTGREQRAQLAVRNRGGNLTPGLQTKVPNKSRPDGRRQPQVSGAAVALTRQALPAGGCQLMHGAPLQPRSSPFHRWDTCPYSRSTSFLRTLKPNKREPHFFKVSQNSALIVRACAQDAPAIKARPTKTRHHRSKGACPSALPRTATTPDRSTLPERPHLRCWGDSGCSGPLTGLVGRMRSKARPSPQPDQAAGAQQGHAAARAPTGAEKCC